MPWPGIAHRCYRGSRATTATVAAMLTIHRAARTWDNAVDAYIALTEFARRKLIEGGLPASKIHVKPNFVHPDPGVADGSGGYALFVGRLTPEKGLLTLLAAWERLDGMIPLKIVGDGPLQSPVREAERRFKCIQWLGQCPTQETHRLIGAATMLIFPSTWYETFGRVAIEAFAKGTPVIASNLGAMAELVDHGRTGYLFPAGNAVALADTIQQMVASANDLKSMRRAARAEFEGKYTAEQNGPALEAIYRAACRVAHRSTTRRSS
jgi:glycosyltransferase involved in cell wall biosynthesis